MMRACTASVISMNWVSRSSTISGSRCSVAALTSAEGRLLAYREPSSTASALTPTAASSETYRCSPAGSSGSAIPVESTSSPPRSRWAAWASSITCTQRTGASSRSAPASTRGAPLRTGSSARTSLTVGSTCSSMSLTCRKRRSLARLQPVSWRRPSLAADWTLGEHGWTGGVAAMRG